MFKAAFLATVVAGANAANFYTHEEPVGDDTYVVVFKQHTSRSVIDAHFANVNASVQVQNEWNIGKGIFRGYAAKADKAGLASLLKEDAVDFVEENGIYRALQTCETQTQTTWGIGDTCTGANTNYEWEDNSAGESMNVYVIDTGVYEDHSEFEDRGSFGADFTGEGPGDGNGHGTHCAGTVGGLIYGMAIKANLIGVKVLGASGSGSTNGVISGVDWASRASGVSILTMSLGGGASAAMDNAVTAATQAGDHVIVASGNSNTDACGSSPARAGGTGSAVVTVNSYQENRQRSSFSNYGSCTDIYAPGTSINSAWIGSRTATRIISGTSMACPHVTGQLAKYLTTAGRGDSPMTAKSWLIQTAKDGEITNVGANTPNKRLFADCADFDIRN